ncbi:MAG: hypothetical protein AAGF31_07740 [Planctomycetota bacterium]
MRTDVIRSEILRLIESRPYQPFEINIENGDRIVVEHPENIAMGPEDATDRFANRVHVIGHQVMICTTLDAISTVAEIDQGHPMGGDSPK